ncbi:hypothetical protein HHK36_021823 [Tetracentron sinense]|uniref:Uncharacterized protein n=1 Tax=Tetracentron sinense TaxID=13715 RepID=A0A834YQE3_TETSI|nr:hypothetical protein HHK36_021823 [Tetracentron sinense]
MFLDLILNFGDGLLHEFLVMHRSVAEMTQLIDMFSSIYAKGLNIFAEDQVENTGCATSRDAKGTGIREGTALSDVSHQIVNEDQMSVRNSENTEDVRMRNWNLKLGRTWMTVLAIKSLDKDEDGLPNNSYEKYEIWAHQSDLAVGASLLRAKEDGAATVDESGECTPDESNNSSINGIAVIS